MLSATCPEPGCNNPLMRDRLGKEQCVSCTTTSGAGSGSRSSAPVTSTEQGAAPTPAPGEPAVPLQAAGDFAGETEPEDVKEEAFFEDEAERRYTEQRMAELLSPPATGVTVGTEREASSGAKGAGVDPLRVKGKLLDTLYRALDLSEQRLRACACCSPGCVASVDVEKAMREADLIAKLALAARAVQNLPSKA